MLGTAFLLLAAGTWLALAAAADRRGLALLGWTVGGALTYLGAWVLLELTVGRSEFFRALLWDPEWSDREAILLHIALPALVLSGIAGGTLAARVRRPHGTPPRSVPASLPCDAGATFELPPPDWATLVLLLLLGLVGGCAGPAVYLLRDGGESIAFFRLIAPMTFATGALDLVAVLLPLAVVTGTARRIGSAALLCLAARAAGPLLAPLLLPEDGRIYTTGGALGLVVAPIEGGLLVAALCLGARRWGTTAGVVVGSFALAGLIRGVLAHLAFDARPFTYIPALVEGIATGLLLALGLAVARRWDVGDRPTKGATAPGGSLR